MAARRSLPGGRRSSSAERRRKAKSEAPPNDIPIGVEEIEARAARLGITVDRVLLEYAHIAFADLRHLIEWEDGRLKIKAPDQWTDADAAAVAEIVPGADAAHSRVKLYDKKAALAAIARHLGMFPLPSRRHDEPEAPQEGEDPREFLARELARLAAGKPEE